MRGIGKRLSVDVQEMDMHLGMCELAQMSSHSCCSCDEKVA